VIRPVAWTLAGLSAASPRPSAGQAPWIVAVPREVVTIQCAGECPTNTDRLELLAKLLPGILASSALSTQAMIGT